MQLRSAHTAPEFCLGKNRIMHYSLIRCETGRKKMMNPNTGRSSIFAVVGGYLIYMAYEILRDMINDVPTTMSRFLRILVIVLFTGIGITLLFFAWRFWKKGREDQDKNPVDLEEQEAKANNEKDLSEK